MSKLTMKFYSNCLRRNVSFNMFLPYDERQDVPEEMKKYKSRKTKVLFLLHGYTGDGDIWVPEYLADKYNFAIVAPDGENAFWLDGISTGHQFGTFLGEELPRFIRKTFNLATSSQDTYIMGFSMGGFGALRTALKYPDVFGKTVALSSALIVHEVAGMTEGYDNGVANFEYYRECFGDPKKVLESDNNPEALVKKLKAEGKKFPEIFMACGTEDFLVERNREFHKFLESENVPHVYEEDTGIHDMVFWSKCVEKFVPILFG